LRIAVFTKNLLNPAYEGARLGADRAAARLGATTAHYVPQEPDDPVEQTALIEKALAESPDAFVLVPAHPTAVSDAIRTINESGIPLVTFINRLTAGDCVALVSSDDYALASNIAHHVFDQLDGIGKVVIVEGPDDSITSIPRVQGFRDADAENTGIEVVGFCAGAFLREPAREAMARMLDQQPQVDAVLAANDSMALGVLDALDEAGRSALVAGINAIPEAIEAIKTGRMFCTADFNAMNMAYVATECAIRHLQGGAVPDEIMLPAQLVDRDNYALWDKPFAERECPSLREVLADGAPMKSRSDRDGATRV
jgi:ribose transport system substrate-binding protein